MMDSTLRLFLIISAVLVCDISCTKRQPERERLRDVAQAITRLNENLPGRTTMDERCKRYAVLASRTIAERTPYLRTVSKVLALDDKELDEIYEKLGIDRIIYAYVSAIDKYRVTELAPAFINLIECLARIDTPVVRAYLNNQELTIISNLYKQVLGLPGTKVDLRNLDLTKFCTAFWTSLKYLFSPYLDIHSIFSSASIGVGDTNFQSSGSASEMQQSQTERNLFQRRERSRLINQRLRIMDPDRVRRYHDNHRNLSKEREQLMLLQSPDAVEVIRAKKRALERRNRANKRRRERRKQLKDQLLHQRQMRNEFTPANLQPPSASSLHEEHQRPQPETSQAPSTRTTINEEDDQADAFRLIKFL